MNAGARVIANVRRSVAAGAGGPRRFPPPGLAELSGLSDLVAQARAPRRGFNVIEHRPPGPRPGEQPGGDPRVRRWLTAGTEHQLGTQSLITCPGW